MNSNKEENTLKAIDLHLRPSSTESLILPFLSNNFKNNERVQVEDDVAIQIPSPAKKKSKYVNHSIQDDLDNLYQEEKPHDK